MTSSTKATSRWPLSLAVSSWACATWWRAWWPRLSEADMAEEKKSKTLWEMFAARFHHNGNGNGAAIAIANPLDWRIGEAETFASTNGAEFMDFTFTVKEIREYVRR